MLTLANMLFRNPLLFPEIRAYYTPILNLRTYNNISVIRKYRSKCNCDQLVTGA